MVPQEFTVDLNKPLVFQVGHLGGTYQEWIHQPIATKGGPRFFESDFWEFLTLTVWWVIPLVWLPVVCFCISRSIWMGHGVGEVAVMVVFGILIWTLLEYTLHRFLFHIKTKSYWGNTMHYLLHGCRILWMAFALFSLLQGPPFSACRYCLHRNDVNPSQYRRFWKLIELMATPSTTPAVFGGGLLGYVMYDVTHYYLHHEQPTTQVPKSLNKYHMNHHFRIQNKGFGITSSLWDRVFGTLPPSMSAKKSR